MNIPSATVNDVRNAIDSMQDVTVIDVRTPDEFKMGHIPGSKLMPVDEIDRLADKALADKTKKLFLYCRTGIRSGRAVQILRSLGYTAVFNVSGGMSEWMRHGYPVQE